MNDWSKFRGHGTLTPAPYDHSPVVLNLASLIEHSALYALGLRIFGHRIKARPADPTR